MRRQNWLVTSTSDWKKSHVILFHCNAMKNRQLEGNDIYTEDDLWNSTIISNTIEKSENVEPLATKEISTILKRVLFKTFKLTTDVRASTKYEMKSNAASAKVSKKCQAPITNVIKVFSTLYQLSHLFGIDLIARARELMQKKYDLSRIFPVKKLKQNSMSVMHHHPALLFVSRKEDIGRKARESLMSLHVTPDPQSWC